MRFPRARQWKSPQTRRRPWSSTNALLRGKITGHKTGAEQAPLEGVTFGLFSADVNEFTEETAIEVAATNEAGEFVFEAPYGNYQVKELETVPGYVTLKESINVELGKTDVDLEDIANSQTVVHFSKVDAETGEELPGAVLNCTPRTDRFWTPGKPPTFPMSFPACPWARATSCGKSPLRMGLRLPRM